MDTQCLNALVLPNCLVFIRSNREYIAVHVTPLYMKSMHVTDC